MTNQTLEETFQKISQILRPTIILPEIIPCPFCGNSAHLNENGCDDYGYYSFDIVCNHCETLLSSDQIRYRGDPDFNYNCEVLKSVLIKRWNTRF